MKKIILTSLIATSALMTGCSNSVPACGDTETTDLVSKIAGDELARQMGAEDAKTFSFSVNAIRTTNTHEQTGAHECAAQLEVIPNGKDSGNEIPITYTVENTDDGEQFYVNVFGL